MFTKLNNRVVKVAAAPVAYASRLVPVPAVVGLGRGDVEGSVVGSVRDVRAHRARFVLAHLAVHGPV